MGTKKSIWSRFWGRAGARTVAAQDQANDIRNLFKDLGLDADQYRHFGLSQTMAESAKHRDEVFIPPARPRASFVRANVKIESARQEVSEVSAIAPIHEKVARPAENNASLPQGLGIGLRAGEHLGALHSDRSLRFPLLKSWGEQEARRAGKQLSAPIVGFVSYTGGVGKSTLVAALGAAFARLGVRSLIVGQTPYSPLSYYFGGPRTLPGDSGGSVQQYSYTIPGAEQPIALMIGSVSTSDLVRYARDRMTETSITLMDMEASPRTEEDMPHFDMVAVPLRPDVNALVTIERIERLVESLANRPPLGVWYILNQFDATRDLHVQIHDVLRQRLGDRLLPFVMPLDNSVQEALASGQPPQVYRSYTPFSKAIDNFHAWLSDSTKLSVGKTVGSEK